MSASEITVSVIVPLFNEEEILPPLIQRLQSIRCSQAHLEWIFVDDGSKDQTYPKIRELAPSLSQWKIIRLVRNFGQQPAYRAGLHQASGSAVVFLDADLQDPPEMIPDMIREWQAGSKLVIPCRKSRKERGLRGFAFKIFHRFFHRFTGGVMPENSGTFGLMDRSIVDQLNGMQEASVFFQALRCWVGHPPKILWYDRQERIGGEVKQNYNKLLRQAWDALASFSEVPLRTISYLGLLISIFGFAYAGFLLVIRLMQEFGHFQALNVPGFTTVAVTVLCLGGIQLISIGILGEYIGRIYQEVKKRPPYLVDSVESSP